MTSFTISGNAWFDGAAEPVIWAKDGAVGYCNPAARRLGQRLEWDLNPGAPLPPALSGAEADTTAELELQGREYLLRTQAADGGLLIQLRPLELPGTLPDDRVAFWAQRFRTPLGNLIGTIQLVDHHLQGRPLDEKMRQCLAVQKKSYYTLLRMLDSLECISRTEEAAFRPALLDLGGLCMGVVRKVAALAEPYGYRITMQRGSGNLLVRGDEQMLVRMLCQLISNAMRAAAGGEITLFLEQVRQEARLTVTDSGAGIAPEELANAFDPAAGENPHAGLGLGLAICQKTVQRHGGRLLLFSGAGGRAVVTLPLCQSVPRAPLRSGGGDYNGGLDQILLQLADVLPWQSFAGGE